MHTRTLGERVDAGELVLCLALVQARTPDIPMMAAACGFDAIYVDLEHTAASLETASMLCSAALGSGLFPLVRVPSHDHQYMTRAIDTGALGVIVPHVNTPAQARQIVDTCRFPPVGHRSIVGPNPATGYRPMKPTEVVEYLDRHTVLAAMLETPEAIASADAIAAVPGLDMLLIGTHDLTMEMGILGQFRHPRFAEAMLAAAAACRAHGKIMGVAGIRDLELLGELVAQGVRFISAGTDSGFFMEAASAHAARLRGIPVGAAGGTIRPG
jgi:2-keto-3-deoxy-L-rhamnonate aldolase RhmA